MVENNTLIMLPMKKVVAVKRREVKFHLKMLDVGVSHGHRLDTQLEEIGLLRSLDRISPLLTVIVMTGYHMRLCILIFIAVFFSDRKSWSLRVINNFNNSKVQYNINSKVQYNIIIVWRHSTVGHHITPWPWIRIQNEPRWTITPTKHLFWFKPYQPRDTCE